MRKLLWALILSVALPSESAETPASSCPGLMARLLQAMGLQDVSLTDYAWVGTPPSQAEFNSFVSVSRKSHLALPPRGSRLEALDLAGFESRVGKVIGGQQIVMDQFVRRADAKELELLSLSGIQDNRPHEVWDVELIYADGTRVRLPPQAGGEHSVSGDLIFYTLSRLMKIHAARGRPREVVYRHTHPSPQLLAYSDEGTMELMLPLSPADFLFFEQASGVLGNDIDLRGIAVVPPGVAYEAVFRDGMDLSVERVADAALANRVRDGERRRELLELALKLKRENGGVAPVVQGVSAEEIEAYERSLTAESAEKLYVALRNPHVRSALELALKMKREDGNLPLIQGVTPELFQAYEAFASKVEGLAAQGELVQSQPPALD